MAQTLDRDAGPQLLHYRPWRGELRSPAVSVWPIARVAMGMMIRRKLFWGLYGLGMLFFLLFFFGQYLLAYAATQTAGPSGGNNNQGDIIQIMKNLLDLNGTGKSYRTFFGYQGHILMVILALAGSVIIGNDVRFGSLPFYLSKPLSRWHYLGGKALAVAFFINLLTTVPALVLFVQYGLLDSWEYFKREWPLVLGIQAYGAVLTLSLTLLLLATAMWLRKTVPLIMVWSTLFFFCRVICDTVVDRLDRDKHWRLFDLWNDTVIVGSACLGVEPPNELNQPEWALAALVLGGVSLVCLMYLILRIRAVEVVR